MKKNKRKIIGYWEDGRYVELSPMLRSALDHINAPSIETLKQLSDEFDTQQKNTHGGKRKGAGRKPTLLPSFLKKFRATESEWREFLSLLTGDARKDFVMILDALKRFPR